MIDLAKEHGIPIQEDPGLTRVLAQLDFYQEIPPKIYAVVAEILAFVYKLNRQAPGAQNETGEAIISPLPERSEEIILNGDGGFAERQKKVNQFK
jgi:hypothetical protein